MMGVQREGATGSARALTTSSSFLYIEASKKLVEHHVVLHVRFQIMGYVREIRRSRECLK